MAAWARVVKPLAGREVGGVYLFGDHEVAVWVAAGIIEQVDDPTAVPTVAEAPERVKAVRKAPARKAVKE